MNKFIEYDIHNGIIQLKCAIMNILDALNSMEIDSYDFGEYISENLILECIGQLGWQIDGDICCSPNRKDFFIFKNNILKLYEHSNFNAI